MEQSKDTPSSRTSTALERANQDKAYLARIRTLLQAGFSALRQVDEEAITSINTHEELVQQRKKGRQFRGSRP